MTRGSQQLGISLIEVLVGVSIITVSLIAIGFSVTAYVDARAALLVNTKSMYLAEEGYETLRAIRDVDWNTVEALALDTEHYFDISTSTIGVTGTPEIIDTDYRRWFVLQEVHRNSDDDIVAPGGLGVTTVDPGARDVTVYVQSPTGTSSLRAILTNLHAL
jgi:type II secretory pathway pseudopilin PulG